MKPNEQLLIELREWYASSDPSFKPEFTLLGRHNIRVQDPATPDKFLSQYTIHKNGCVTELCHDDEGFYQCWFPSVDPTLL